MIVPSISGVVSNYTVFPPKTVEIYSELEALDILHMINLRWLDLGVFPQDTIAPWAELIKDEEDPHDIPVVQYESMADRRSFTLKNYLLSNLSLFAHRKNLSEPACVEQYYEQNPDPEDEGWANTEHIVYSMLEPFVNDEGRFTLNVDTAQ